MSKGDAAGSTVDIYMKFGCPYCAQAKRLLEEKGVAYNEYDISLGGEKAEEMRKRNSAARTVPQIFVGNQSLGGADHLAALDRDGKLDDILGI